jgi:DNA-binding NarL/FixJ family response regulator
MARILIVDDHPALRAGLRDVLQTMGGYLVVGEAGTGLEAVARARELEPDLVVLDVAMPNLGGVEAARRIRAARPGTRILVLTQHDEVPTLRALLHVGVVGIVTKAARTDELLDAVSVVLDDGEYLDARLSRNLLDACTQPGPEQTVAALDALSPREREVMELVSDGLTSAEAAARLGIGVRTVEHHRRRGMEKLGVRSVAALARVLARVGVKPLDPPSGPVPIVRSARNA